jgi:hypothetical protein
MKQRAFRRKVLYLLLMAALLLPLTIISRPATTGSEPESGSRGGILAQLRAEHRLSQTQLGEIDPTSETLKLATFGLRGVAANLLWEKAREDQMKANWTSLHATLKQISNLQPNFVSVWRFQAWNLSYNVSVEWDNYKDRYFWVIQGIKYLDEGQKHNDTEVRLLRDEGWFTGYKIGKSDEYRQFRVLFRNDEINPIHPPTRPEGEPRDNWLVGRESYLEAIDLVDKRGAQIRGTSPLLFYAEPTKCMIRYIAAREEEGRFGDFAREWWSRATDEWIQYANRSYASTTGGTFRMSDLDAAKAKADAAVKQLDDLEPGLRQKLREQRLAALTPLEQKMLDPSFVIRRPEDQGIVSNLMHRVQVTNQDVALSVPPEKRAEAQRLTKLADDLNAHYVTILGARSTVNYDYWLKRCQAESSDLGLQAREMLYQAHVAYTQDQYTARKPYEEAFKKWRELIDKYPEFAGDGELGEDLVNHIRRYREALKAHNEPFPKEDFILNDVIKQRMPYPPIE